MIAEVGRRNALQRNRNAGVSPPFVVVEPYFVTVPMELPCCICIITLKGGHMAEVVKIYYRTIDLNQTAMAMVAVVVEVLMIMVNNMAEVLGRDCEISAPPPPPPPVTTVPLSISLHSFELMMVKMATVVTYGTVMVVKQRIDAVSLLDLFLPWIWCWRSCFCKCLWRKL